MISSHRKYKDAKKKEQEYEFASKMDEIFGKCHFTNLTFVVESSSTSTSKPKTQKSRAKEQSPSSSSNCVDNNKESSSSKDNKKQINY